MRNSIRTRAKENDKSENRIETYLDAYMIPHRPSDQRLYRFFNHS